MTIKTAFVVDDSRVARVILGRLLVSKGLEVTEIESGDEALALLKHGVRPDVIFMDMVMQGLSGVETSARIKSELKIKDIPIVMCTGNDASKESQSAIAAGVSCIIAKPPTNEELETVLTQFNRAISGEHSFRVINEMPSPEVDTTSLRKEVSSEMDEKIEKATKAWQPMLNDVSLQMDEKINRVTGKWSPIIEEVSSEMDGKIEKAKQALLPVMQENISIWMEKEQIDLDEKIFSAAGVKAKEVGKEISEKVVSDLAVMRVDQAIRDANISGKLSAMLTADIPDWLETQQVEIEQALLPEMEKKLTTSLTAKMETEIERGIKSEAMLQIKANVQEDVHAMLNDMAENTIKPLQRKVYILMGIVMFLVLMILIF